MYGRVHCLVASSEDDCEDNRQLLPQSTGTLHRGLVDLKHAAVSLQLCLSVPEAGSALGVPQAVLSLTRGALITDQ